VSCENNNIAILGLGKSGRAALTLAVNHKFNVIAVDDSNSPKLQSFADSFSNNPNINFILGERDRKFSSCDEIVISPGISPTSKLGKNAIDSKIPIISELEFGLRYLDAPCLAVTGTNGKTTVTEMTTAILTHAGLNAVSAGNIGVSTSEIACSDSKYDVAVIEASSFQLDNIADFTPVAAALLNIHSDHIDWHSSFENYAKAKFNIFKNLKEDSSCIMNKNLSDMFALIANYKHLKPFTFSIDGNDADIYYNSLSAQLASTIFSSHISASILKNWKKHNIENLLASSALAAKILKNPKDLTEAVRKLIETFHPAPHRQELVAVHEGISFVNDSKSTNPASLIAALGAFSRKQSNICLIAGGLDKKMDFSDVIQHKNKIKAIFLIGDSKKSLVSLWNYDIHCILCDSLEDAVTGAADIAVNGDVVMLSPGCASMDMFENYKERGNVFRSFVLNKIIGEQVNADMLK